MNMLFIKHFFVGFIVSEIQRVSGIRELSVIGYLTLLLVSIVALKSDILENIEISTINVYITYIR